MDQKDRVVRLTATVTRDGAWFGARCLEVEGHQPGRDHRGRTSESAQALELYFEDEPVPAGSEPIVAPVEIRIPA